MARRSKATPRTVHRSAKTGRFVPASYARRRPATTVRETVRASRRHRASSR